MAGQDEAGDDEARGELQIPESDRPQEVANGVWVGPVWRPGWVSRFRLKNPKFWPVVGLRAGAAVLKCPYCLALIANRKDGQEHLYRMHRAAGTAPDPVAWLAGLEQRFDQLEEDIQNSFDVINADLGADAG